MTALPYALSPERPPQIGLIVLQADETIERDMKRLIPDGVELLVSRVASATEVTSETLAAMEGDLQRAASLFPAAARFEAVGYGCTSGTAQIGAANVAAAVQAGCVTPRVTEPVSALIAACRHLGATKIGLLSPYIESVSRPLYATLEAAGITVSAFASFEESEEARVVRIAPQSIKAAAVALAAQHPLDALFISCTNLRTLGLIEDIEAEIGIPTLSSNQVLAWDMLRLAQISDIGNGPGVLWSKHAEP